MPPAAAAPFPNRYAPRRKNGLSPPYSKAQMVTWFAWPLLVLQFFVFASPNLPIAASIPVSLIFGVVAVTVVYFAYQTIQADPMDVYLSKHLRRQVDSSNNNNNNDDDDDNHHDHCDHHGACDNTTRQPEPMKQCWICDTQVAEHSMHCKFCNKCVSHFDHHCMWLNTCIGDVNYSTFFQTMIWITAMLTIHFVVQGSLFIALLVERSSNEEGVIRRRAEGWFHPRSSSGHNHNDGVLIALIVVWALFCLVDMMGLALILQLLSFHIRLRKKKLSTYLFIVAENQRKREALRKAGLRRAKRIDTMAQARQEGKTFHALRLRMGGNALIGKYCPCCDPLPPDEEEEEVEFGTMPKKAQTSTTSQSNGITFVSVKSLMSQEDGKETTEPTTTKEDDRPDEEAAPRSA